MVLRGLMNVKLKLAYDGTGFLGWQKTPIGPSIEEALQKALQTILGHEVNLQAASRTDAGVHAKGQIVNFFTEQPLDFKRLKHSLNGLLPENISVLEIQEMELNFHPTLDNVGKEYHYHLCLGRAQLPQFRNYSWHIPYPLNLENMQTACQLLIGEQDFSSFCNSKKNDVPKSTVRTLKDISVCALEGRCRITVSGSNFLYKMVRNLVGTIVYIGLGKIELDSLAAILESKDRKLAGITAPAHGLTLFEVFY